MNLLIAMIIPALLGSAAVADTCDIPQEYANKVTVVESDMSISFATDELLYTPGGYVNFYLVVKNIGTTTFYMNWGIDPQNAVFVMPESCTDVNQPGCFGAAVFYYPTTIYFYSSGTTLGPGECRVWTNTWDIWNWGGGPPPVGTYTVLGGMFEADPVTPPGEFRLPVGGVMLNVTIDYAIPAKESTWGQVKTLYR